MWPRCLVTLVGTWSGAFEKLVRLPIGSDIFICIVLNGGDFTYQCPHKGQDQWFIPVTFSSLPEIKICPSRNPAALKNVLPMWEFQGEREWRGFSQPHICTASQDLWCLCLRADGLLKLSHSLNHNRWALSLHQNPTKSRDQ